jgi:ATP-dependent Clp protease protease subunit
VPGGLAVHPAAPAGPDPLLDRLLDERIVYLGGDLDDAAADRVIAQLLLLGALEPHRDITVQLNARGGSAAAGLAVHDTLRGLGVQVATRAIGLLGPVAALLLAAGTPGRRHALPHARILLAVPGAGAAGAGNSAARAGVVGAQRRQVAELLARYTGRPVDAASADLVAERRLSAPEALEYGLVDVVIEA